MANAMYCVAVAFVLAAAVVEADLSASSRDGPRDGEPKDITTLLQTKLQTNAGIPLVGLEVDSVALMDAFKDPTAMLTALENMVLSGDTPTFDLMAEIKRIINEEVMPGLTSSHEASALDTTEHLNAFHACNNKSKTREGEIKNSTEKTVDSSRSLHATCRDVEKALHGHNLTHNESYCNKLADFLHDAEAVGIPIGSSRTQAVASVKSASSTNMCSGSEVKELDDLCTGKEDELNNHSAECSTKQVSFEAYFCQWKRELEANCDALDTCYSAARTAYDDHVNKTRALVEKWNLETAALHKILCFADTWLSDTHEHDGRSEHNTSHFHHCNDLTHVPDERDYGTPPEKVACPLTSVQNYPGTSGFIDQEYSGLTEFAEDVEPCTESTAAPTSLLFTNILR